MSPRNYSFDAQDCEFDASLEGVDSEPDQLREVTLEIFRHWSRELLEADQFSAPVPLHALLTRRTEGQSEANVFELSFREAAGAKPTIKFIVRIHAGDSRVEDASQEYRLVRHVAVAGTSGDYFSAKLIGPFEKYPNVVVYRHADDEFGYSSMLLREAIIDYMRSPAERLELFSKELGNLLRAVVETYNTFKDPSYYANGEAFFNIYRRRMLPHLVCDCTKRELVVQDKDLIVLTSDFEMPAPSAQLATLTLNDLHASYLASDRNKDPRGWVRLSPVVIEGRVPQGEFIRFRSGEIRMWLRADVKSLNFPDLEQVTAVTVKLGDVVAGACTQHLQEQGFSEDSILPVDEFEQVCKALVLRLDRGIRHNDLHCRNIVVSNLRFKVIDLGSAAEELIATSHARLEISLWQEIDRLVELDRVEVSRIIDSLDAEKDLPQDTVSRKAWAFYVILRTIREALQQHVTEFGIARADVQITLAYAIQIILHQRYVLRQGYRVQHSLNAISQYWVRRLRQCISKGDGGELPTSADPDVNGGGLMLTEVEPGEPTLFDLWEAALQSKSLPGLEARPEEFLANIVAARPELRYRTLTKLQCALLQPVDGHHPFQSNRHVIIAAPTSSGKSTAAEMFLLGPPLLNNRRTASLYIAPTRALTQSKYRELRDRLSGDPETESGVVLSTGEDSDDDWKITHGQFSVACMVYEKANILFSQNRRLLDRLGCVVVDEMHMLVNLDRGPILETVLTKMLRERRDSDALAGRGPATETLRIIAISTEDQLDAAIRQFLSVVDPDTGVKLEPLVYCASERPVAVQHVLVLPGTQQGDYMEFPFVRFVNSKDRKLTPAEISVLDKRLLTIARRARGEQKGMNLSRFKEVPTRLHSLLCDLLAKNPRGYRALVFVPGRVEAEQQARRLKNTLMRLRGQNLVGTTPGRAEYDYLLDQLKEHVDRAEDRRMAEMVWECASVGIFIHHSEIDRKIRFVVEEICSRVGPTLPSQVIFATETLSYGINLAVRDVILLGTHFFTQTRFRNQLRLEGLSGSEFHNMLGRAGRLGKLSGAEDARAYIIAPEFSDALQTIKDYYMAVEPPISKVYVRDDRDVQLRIKDNVLRVDHTEDGECGAFSDLSALDFSYPFVRTVLDSLRHLNSIAMRESEGTGIAVDDEQLLEFLSGTLYARQNIGSSQNAAEKVLFRCAVKQILHTCTAPDLHLVEPRPLGYVITRRGEAIIDTGTELQTVQPLLTLAQRLQVLWSDLFSHIALPPELYILCLIGQNEVFRQFVRNAPECKGSLDKSWPRALAEENRDLVLRETASSVEKISRLSHSDAFMFATRLREVIDQWEPVQVEGGYQYAGTDSLLRFFNGMIAWVTLEDRAVIETLMEGSSLPEGFRGRIERFRQFTDLLNVKTLFLSRMLATEKDPHRKLSQETERHLHLLTHRLRLGCTADAIPMFWPFSSDFRRIEAKKLLAERISPSTLLAVADPNRFLAQTLEIAPEKLEVLRQDLERFAQKEFSELQEEMTFVPTNDLRREATQELWRKLGALFGEAIAEYRNSGDIDLYFDETLRQTFVNTADDQSTTEMQLNPGTKASLDERYRVLVEVPTYGKGFVWQGERLVYESSADVAEHTYEPRVKGRFVPDKRVMFIGAHFRRDWTCKVGNSPWRDFAEVLRENQSVAHLTVVVIPWTPPISELPDDARELLLRRFQIDGYSTTIVSCAAFAMMTSAVVRDFLSAEISVKTLTHPRLDATPFNVVGVGEILLLLDSTPDREIPPSIREKLLRHFEVVPTVA